ncbi:MAG: hypothetical protein AAF902_04185 [Chloroflexota bacterium]
MKFGKYFYMGLGAFIALAIGASAFSFSQSSEAAADSGFGPALQDGIEDFSRRGRGDRDGQRGNRDRDNSALLEELGVTEEEWDAAKEAARESFADAEERPSREERLVAFAQALGVSVEELEAAKEAVKEARLAEALANGDITQEQVDLREARQALAETIDKVAIMADILGVSVEEINTAREERTLRDLIADSGLTNEEIAAATEAAYQDAIDQALADGVITQEQADLLEENGLKNNRSRKGDRNRGNRGNSNFDNTEVETADI